MLSSFGIRFSDEKSNIDAEAADRNVEEVCMKNAKDEALPSSSQFVAPKEESKKSDDIISTEVKEQPLSLFGYLYSAAANTYNLLVGGYGVNIAPENVISETNGNADKIAADSSSQITCNDNNGSAQSSIYNNKRGRERTSRKQGYPSESNDHNSVDVLADEKAQQKEAISEVSCKIQSLKKNIEEATKVLNYDPTFAVEETMDDALAMYRSAVENLEQTTEEAKNAATQLLNRSRKIIGDPVTSEKLDVQTDDSEADVVEIAVQDYTNYADEKFASKSDNPYEETLARLEQATIQVKNVAENLLNKQQKEAENCVQGTSREAQEELDEKEVGESSEESDVESVDTVSSFEDELSYDVDDAEIAEDVEQSASQHHASSERYGGMTLT
ncbi:hypothetical protein Tcan_18494 [Toxocara canis]|uniref:Uncharacterized protein n=1 Tax=Toxocara canis TaxID=6265 RepID=A0A0B2VVY5_TOXCA|nr:hypothetical protein Tcan_18494 [Toxocara canis]